MNKKKIGKLPAKKLKPVSKRRRVNLKMDSELVEFAFCYADYTETTVTRLITNYFIDLRRREERRLGIDAEQI